MSWNEARKATRAREREHLESLVAERRADRQAWEARRAAKQKRRADTLAAIDAKLANADDLTADEILTLVTAQRLFDLSDNAFALAMSNKEADR